MDVYYCNNYSLSLVYIKKMLYLCKNFTTMLKKIMFMLIMVAIQSVISIVYCENIPKASKWYGIQYHHDYPQKDNVPIITGLTYSIEGDTVINDTTFQKILFTSE